MQSQARTVKDCGKTGSQFSLDSVCSSGYDSAQPDSRTATPSDLQFNLPECYDDKLNFSTTGTLMDFSKCSDPIQMQETSSSADSLSLFSSSTTLNLYSCATCNDKLPTVSFQSTPKSHDARLIEKELEVNQEEDSNCCDGASQVIYSLKRRSDGWTGPLVKPTDPITSRLKRGRAEAIKRQEVIEVYSKLALPFLILCVTTNFARFFSRKPHLSLEFKQRLVKLSPCV